MLSEPRSSLLADRYPVNPRIESESLNFLIILTAGVRYLFPGPKIGRMAITAVGRRGKRVCTANNI